MSNDYKSVIDVVRAYTPRYIFNRHSRVLPTAVPDYIKQCRMLAIDDVEIAPKGYVRDDQLTHADRDDTLQPSGAKLPGSADDNTPLYYAVGIDGDRLVVQYILFFSNNPGFCCCACSSQCNNGFDCCPKLGFHDADIEHVTIEFERFQLQPVRVYFAAHGSRQGQWIPFDECNRVKTGDAKNANTILVHVAHGSNASYNDHGCYPRLCCITNDFCDDENNGLVWDPTRLELLTVVTPLWNQYNGTLGYGSVHTPVRSSWWLHEDGQSIGWFGRLFGCICW